MTLNNLVRNGKKVAVDHSPAILTAIGVTGVVTTAYLVGQASFKAADIIRDLENVEGTHGDRLPRLKERSAMVWKLYLPAVGVASFTIAAIIMANRVGTRRTAAMAAAYTISERAYSEYKDKVVETIGKNKEEKVRADIAQDRINKNPIDASSVIVTGTGKCVCQDAWSMRVWSCSMEEIKSAQNDTNYQVLNHGYASLSDFYNRVGLENTKESDDVGWNSDKLMEVYFTSAISDKNEPVLVMDFSVAPVRNFFRTH